MAEESKLCPLRVLAVAMSSRSAMTAAASRRCVGETCAWWNEGAQCCGVIAPGVLQAEERELVEKVEKTYEELADLLAEPA